MFHALKFGEKPPPGTVPMQPRGADNRAHIYSQRPPDAKANAMNATSSWAPRHSDPATAEEHHPSTAHNPMTSAILQRRERQREIPAKPQDVPLATQGGGAVVYAKPVPGKGAPFAMDDTTAKGAGAAKASQAYGAFAVPQAPPHPIVQTDNSRERIVDLVPAHKLLTNAPAQAVIGTFDGPEHHPPQHDGAAASAAAGPYHSVTDVAPAAAVDVMQPDALRALVTDAMVAKPATGHGASATAGAAAADPRRPTTAAPTAYQLPTVVNPRPTSAVPRNKQEVASKPNALPQPSTPLPRTMLSSSALQALGNWRYQHTPHPARATERESRGSASTAPSESVVPPSATGPQIDWWVKSQKRYADDRREEGAVVSDALRMSKANQAQQGVLPAGDGPRGAIGTGELVAASRADPMMAPTAAPPPPAQSGGPLTTPPPAIAPGTTLVVQQDGSLKLVPPNQAAAAVPLQAKPQAPLGAKPQTTAKSAEADLPPPPPHGFHTALPISVTAALRNAPVVQSVGGLPPTSIARKTHDTIRAERDAQMRARWLLEAPARAEALQRKVDAVLKSLRASVESKGFSEPTKGAQYVIKVCRQHTSTPNDEMDFDGLRGVLEKGFGIGLSVEECDALFDRLDWAETTVVPFRAFGETVFGLVGPKAPNQQRRRLELMNPATRKVLEEVKAKCAQRHGGETWLLAFSKTFRALNQLGGSVAAGGDGNKTLTPKELHAALIKLGITHLTLHDANNLVHAMDTDKSGTVDEDEFLYAMRGPVSRQRRELIFMAFNILDADRSGSVSLDEIAARFDAKQHPRVLAGEATEHEVLREFISLWDCDADADVSWAEFLDYYKTLSAAIENDEYFELMIRNCWHLSGGKGAAQNTTCRRVLVIYHDKTQRVREIENDLGIGPRDLDKMKAQLERQGERNIERIELYG